jgi:NTP pyrophosphatase (non-canonical NTP hydrolase)
MLEEFNVGYAAGFAAGQLQHPLQQHLDNVVNKSWNFAGRCKTWEDHIMNAAVGLAAEAGETLDIHKKMLFHTEGVDYRDKLRHELGDVCFYLPKLIELHGFTLQEVLAANKTKLESRHPELGVVTERFKGEFIR